MTTLAPSQTQNKYSQPGPLDQPTPQSPPSSCMSNNHAPSNMNSSDKYNSQSLPNMATPPPSFGNAPRPIQTNAPYSLLTPSSSGAPNSAHEDVDIEGMMGGDNSPDRPHKRRRTQGSFQAEHRSDPPSGRSDGIARDYKTGSVSPSMRHIQELISNPDCPPYRLVSEKPHEKLYPEPADNLLQIYGLSSIAEKVARFDASGKKNKLRKSYKGFINGISGKNDVVAKQTQLGQAINQEEHLLQWVAFYPAEDWKNTVGAKSIHNSSFDVNSVRKALSGMTKGDIPGFDASVLGLDPPPC